MVAGAHEGWREKRGEAWRSAYTEGEGRVEGALTGSASAGIRALQILLVREPASGIGGEGARYLASVIFDVGSSRLSGLAGSSAPRERGWREADLMDEPVTERQVAAQAAATDEKTLNLSISDHPPELGKILLF